MSQPKDPAKVRAGRNGARKRWGVQRYVRLDDLSDEERQAVLILIDALRAAKTAFGADS